MKSPRELGLGFERKLLDTTCGTRIHPSTRNMEAVEISPSQRFAFHKRLGKPWTDCCFALSLQLEERVSSPPPFATRRPRTFLAARLKESGPDYPPPLLRVFFQRRG